MRSFRKGIAYALLCMLLLTAIPASGETALEGPHGIKYAADQTLNRLYTTEATSLNAFGTSGSANDWQAISNCVEGLITTDKFGNKVPGLAESWDVSEDGLVYTFHIRKGIQWVDHTGAVKAELTTQDFIAPAKFTLDPAKASSNAYYYELFIKGAKEYLAGETTDFETVGFKAIDDYTLEITLIEPVPYFISTCGSYIPGYAPLVEELGDMYGTSNDTQYYVGAYIMTTFEPEFRRVYEKNPNYYNADEVYIEKIVMTYNKEATQIAPELFKRGETDYAQIETAILDEWKNNPETKDIVIPGLPDTTYMYYYSFCYNPLFDAQYEPENYLLAINNENFRQSLYWGFNRMKAMLVHDPYSPELMLTNTVTPYAWCNVDGMDFTQIGPMAEISARPNGQFEEAKALEYKAKAIEELTAAGVTFPIKFLMPYNPTSSGWENEVQVVKQQLTDLLGADYIECIIEAGPSSGFLAAIRRTGLYGFMKLNNGAVNEDPSAWIVAFAPANNWTFLDKAKGTEIEALVKKYYALIDAAKAIPEKNMERYEKFAEAEAFLLNHAMVIPFKTDTNGYYVAKYNEFDRPHNADELYRGMRVLEEPLTAEQFLALYQDWLVARDASRK